MATNGHLYIQEHNEHQIDGTSEKGVALVRFLFLWDLSSEREAEGRNRQEESPDTAASAETCRRQARP